MSSRSKPVGRLLLAVLGLALVGSERFGARAEAQAMPPLYNLPGGPGSLPIAQANPTGSWAEVLSVTPKWAVLQTQTGQQFPVDLSTLGLFVIRWPTAPNQLGPDAWAELTGMDLGSNRVLVNHVDIYEGAARNLVSPTSLLFTDFNRLMTTYGFQQARSWYDMGFPMLPGEGMRMQRRHVVGPVINRAPLMVATPGNNVMTAVPANLGLTMTQITPGSSSYLRPGDMVWFLPVNATPKSLVLSQMVVYKSIPFRQFAP